VGRGFQFLDQSIELVEPRVPEIAVPFEPVVQPAERLRAQLVEPLLSPRLDLDQAGLFQDAQVLRDLRLIEPQPAADVVHRGGPGAQHLDDAKAGGFGQGGERLQHALEYAPSGICLSRHIVGCYHRHVLPMASDGRAQAVARALAAALRGEPGAWRTLNDPGQESAFLELASEHRVKPLLAWQLGRLDELDHWPGAVRRAIVDAGRAEAALEIARRRDLDRLFPAFESAGIPVLAIKGAALAYTAYPEPWLRPREDTDLLVGPADAARAGVVLAAAGFHPVSRQRGRIVTNQQLYLRPDPPGRRDAIDLHWKIADPAPFADLISFDELLRAGAAVAVGGPPGCRVPSTGHSLLLACWHLIAHHSRDRGERERLLWLYDIHLLANALTEAGRGVVIEVAARTRTAGVCAAALTTARQQFPSPGADALLEHLPRSAIDGSMTPYLRGNARRVDLLVADLRALPGWRSQVRLIREHLFPPAAYMRATYPQSSPVLLPFLYARRIVGGARRWFQRPR